MLKSHRRTDQIVGLWPLVGLLLTALYIGWNPPLQAAARHLIPLVLSLIFGTSFIGWGTFPVRALLREASPTDRVLVAAVIGAGLTGVFTFVPGVFGVISPGLYALWTLVGLILLAFGWKRLVSGHSSPSWKPGTLGSLAVIIIILNLLQLIPMLASPVVSTDAMEYHLMVPKIALATGRITPLPSLVESHYPGLMSFIYLVIMPLAGDIACKAIHFLSGIGVLFAIGRPVDRHFRRQIVDIQHAVNIHHDHRLNCVSQLPNIAGPRVRFHK